MGLDVARGMQALEEHSPPILHRDLKPSNVFIGATGAAKIADFGLARILSPAAVVCLTGETGSYLWMAPEVIRRACCLSGWLARLGSGAWCQGAVGPEVMDSARWPAKRWRLTAPLPVHECSWLGTRLLPPPARTKDSTSLACTAACQQLTAHPTLPRAPGRAGTRRTTAVQTCGRLAWCWWSC